MNVKCQDAFFYSTLYGTVVKVIHSEECKTNINTSIFVFMEVLMAYRAVEILKK